MLWSGRAPGGSPRRCVAEAPSLWEGKGELEMFGRGSKGGAVKKSEDVKKSAGKVLDTKKDTPTRAKVNIFLSAEYVLVWMIH